MVKADAPLVSKGMPRVQESLADPSAVLASFKQCVGRTPFLKYVYHAYLHLLSDAYVISYPKSGRTWLRMMLAKAIALHYDHGDDLVADPLKVVRSGGYPAPRICFDHHGPDRPPRAWKSYGRFKNRAVVFLVRDPRDLLVSYFFHRSRRQGEEHELSAFIRHPWWGIDRVIEYMNDWYDHSDVPQRFMLVRYEDMTADVSAELRRVLDFLGLEDVSDRHLQRAIEYGSFDHVRKLGLNELSQHGKLSPADADDPESYKARRGLVGGYRSYLTSADSAYLDEEIGARLHPVFGYGSGSPDKRGSAAP